MSDNESNAEPTKKKKGASARKVKSNETLSESESIVQSAGNGEKETKETKETKGSHPYQGVDAFLARHEERLKRWYYAVGLISAVTVAVITSLSKLSLIDVRTATLMSAILLGVLVLIALLLPFVNYFKNSENKRSFGNALYEIVFIPYHNRKFFPLLAIQFLLRCIFICIVLAINAEKMSAASSTQLSSSAIVHLIACAVYFAFSIVAIRHVPLGLTGSKTVRPTMWQMAIVDCLLITTIAATSDSISKEFELAYGIPLLTAWLYTDAQGRWLGRWLLFFIILGITSRFLIYEKYSGLVRNESFSRTDMIFGLYLPRVLFWSVIFIPFFILRRVSYIEHSKTQMFESVASNIAHAIFRKNSNREFEYMNKPMRLKLGLSEHESIHGLTDSDLGIDCDEYRDSDNIILNKVQPEWSGVEPNFERKPSPQSDMWVYTSKRALSNESGSKVTGIVGVCEPGTPMILMQTIASSSAFYASLKDEQGYVKWANPAFCIGDAGLALSELLHYNNCKGATDRDIYLQNRASVPTQLIEKYEATDRNVVWSARKALESGRDPLQNPEEGDIYEGEELHYFLRATEGRWVRVVKAPWIDPVKRKVLGVQVIFEDIHQMHCRRWMISRWFTRHLPQAVLVAGRKSRTALSEPSCATVGYNLLALIRLELKIVNWLQSFIDGDTLKTANGKIDPCYFEWCEEVIQALFPDITFNWTIGEVGTYHSCDPDIIGSVLLVFCMNAAESVSRVGTGDAALNEFFQMDAIQQDARPIVNVNVSDSDGNIAIQVEDGGRGFSSLDKILIQRGEKLNADGGPGSGLFLVRGMQRLLGAVFEFEGSEKAGATFSFSVNMLKMCS